MSRARPTMLVLALLASCAALGGASVEESLARTRTALGRAAFETSGTTWRIHGRIRAGGGVEGRFEDLVGRRGRFARRVPGPLGGAEGFDGREAWSADATGRARTIELDARDGLLGDGWLRWGQWADDLPGGAAISRGARGAAPSLELAVGPGWSARVELDEETRLPRAWEVRTSSGVERVELADWRSPRGFAVPHVIRRFTTTGATMVYLVDGVEAIDSEPTRDEALSLAPLEKDDVRFDAEASPEAIARLGPAGHPFVRAELDGRDVGWFLIDSGAGRGIVDERLADELGWPGLGEVAIVGTGAPLAARWRRGGSLALGRFRRANAPWVSVDLSTLSDSVGVPLAGVLGHDFLARAAVELDLVDGRVRVRDPAAVADAEGVALDVAFDGTAPCVRGRFAPGADGWFRIDTGSDDTVAFHAPTVAGRRWPVALEESVRVTVSGFGEPIYGTRVRLPWFEVAGERLHEIPVTLLAGSAGPLERPSISGNLGVGVLRRFHVLLDLGRGRIVLRPR